MAPLRGPGGQGHQPPGPGTRARPEEAPPTGSRLPVTGERHDKSPGAYGWQPDVRKCRRPPPPRSGGRATAVEQRTHEGAPPRGGGGAGRGGARWGQLGRRPVRTGLPCTVATRTSGVTPGGRSTVAAAGPINETVRRVTAGTEHPMVWRVVGGLRCARQPGRRFDARTLPSPRPPTGVAVWGEDRTGGRGRWRRLGAVGWCWAAYCLSAARSACGPSRRATGRPLPWIRAPRRTRPDFLPMVMVPKGGTARSWPRSPTRNRPSTRQVACRTLRYSRPARARQLPP